MIRVHRGLFIALLVAIAAVIFCPVCSAQEAVPQIQQKAQLVEQKAKQWIAEGKNPAPALAFMQQAKQAFDSGNPVLGASLVEKALAFFDAAPSSSASQFSGPTSNLYSNPEQVEITGYDQDAMEPCISLDGKYLFFNNSNELSHTQIFCARRIGPRKFQLMGAVPGTHLVNQPTTGDERECCPSIDRFNRLYYTTTYAYRRGLRTLYCGQWAPAGVKNPQTVQGNIAPSTPGWLDMDCGISPNGDVLVFSRAKLGNGAIPDQSSLMLAHRTADGVFQLDSDTDKILKEVNTLALQYAPAISVDGLELYFTRCDNSSVPTAGMSQPPLMQTMVAFRTGTDKPFGTPARLAAIQGFAEAPSLTLDKQELFFHRKVGDRFRIFRCSLP